MKTYRLKEIPEKYKTLSLDVISLAKQLGDIKISRELRAQPKNNQSLQTIWDNVSAHWQNVFDEEAAIPDVSLWRGLYLTLNQRAYDALSQAIGAEGEFLPMSIEGEHIYLFNCLTFGKEQEELCIRTYIDGMDVGGLDTLFFDEHDIQNKLLYKSLMEGARKLFASEKFKELYEQHNLQGLLFEEDLLAVF